MSNSVNNSRAANTVTPSRRPLPSNQQYHPHSQLPPHPYAPIGSGGGGNGSSSFNNNNANTNNSSVTASSNNAADANNSTGAAAALTIHQQLAEQFRTFAKPHVLASFDVLKVGGGKRLKRDGVTPVGGGGEAKARVMLIRTDGIFFLDVEGVSTVDGKFPDVIKRHIPIGKIKSVTYYARVHNVLTVSVYGEHDCFFHVLQRTPADVLKDDVLTGGIGAWAAAQQQYQQLQRSMSAAASAFDSHVNFNQQQHYQQQRRRGSSGNGASLQPPQPQPSFYMSDEERELSIEKRFGSGAGEGEDRDAYKRRIATSARECYDTLYNAVHLVGFQNSFVALLVDDSTDAKTFMGDVKPSLHLFKHRYFNRQNGAMLMDGKISTSNNTTNSAVSNTSLSGFVAFGGDANNRHNDDDGEDYEDDEEEDEDAAEQRRRNKLPSSVIMRRKAALRREAYVGCLRAAAAAAGISIAAAGATSPMAPSSPMMSGRQSPVNHSHSSTLPTMIGGVPIPPPINEQTRVTLTFWDAISPQLSAPLPASKLPSPELQHNLRNEYIVMMGAVSVRFHPPPNYFTNTSLNSNNPRLQTEEAFLAKQREYNAMIAGMPAKELTVLFTPVKMYLLNMANGRTERQYPLFAMKRLDLHERTTAAATTQSNGKNSNNNNSNAKFSTASGGAGGGSGLIAEREFTLHFLEDVTSSLTFTLPLSPEQLRLQQQQQQGGGVSSPTTRTVVESAGSSAASQQRSASVFNNNSGAGGPSSSSSPQTSKATTNDINAVGNVIRFLLKREGLDLPREHFTNGDKVQKETFVKTSGGPVLLSDTSLQQQQQSMVTPGRGQQLVGNDSFLTNDETSPRSEDHRSLSVIGHTGGQQLALQASLLLQQQQSTALYQQQSMTGAAAGMEQSRLQQSGIGGNTLQLTPTLSRAEYDALSSQEKKRALEEAKLREAIVKKNVPDFREPIDQRSRLFAGPTTALARQILRLTSKGVWEPRTFVLLLNGTLIIADNTSNKGIRRTVPLAQISEITPIEHHEGPALAIGISQEHDLVFKLANNPIGSVLNLQQVIIVMLFLQEGITVMPTERYRGKETMRKVLKGRNFIRPKDFISVADEMKIVQRDGVSPKSLKRLLTPSRVYDERGNLTPRRINSPPRRSSSAGSGGPATPSAAAAAGDTNNNGRSAAESRRYESPTPAATVQNQQYIQHQQQQPAAPINAAVEVAAAAAVATAVAVTAPSATIQPKRPAASTLTPSDASRMPAAATRGGIPPKAQNVEEDLENFESIGGEAPESAQKKDDDDYDAAFYTSPILPAKRRSGDAARSEGEAVNNTTAGDILNDTVTSSSGGANNDTFVIHTTNNTSMAESSMMEQHRSVSEAAVAAAVAMTVAVPPSNAHIVTNNNDQQRQKRSDLHLNASAATSSSSPLGPVPAASTASSYSSGGGSALQVRQDTNHYMAGEATDGHDNNTVLGLEGLTDDRLAVVGSRGSMSSSGSGAGGGLQSPAGMLAPDSSHTPPPASTSVLAMPHSVPSARQPSPMRGPQQLNANNLNNANVLLSAQPQQEVVAVVVPTSSMPNNNANTNNTTNGNRVHAQSPMRGTRGGGAEVVVGGAAAATAASDVTPSTASSPLRPPLYQQQQTPTTTAAPISVKTAEVTHLEGQLEALQRQVAMLLQAQAQQQQQSQQGGSLGVGAHSPSPLSYTATRDTRPLSVQRRERSALAAAAASAEEDTSVASNNSSGGMAANNVTTASASNNPNNNDNGNAAMSRKAYNLTPTARSRFDAKMRASCGGLHQHEEDVNDTDEYYGGNSSSEANLSRGGNTFNAPPLAPSSAAGSGQGAQRWSVPGGGGGGGTPSRRLNVTSPLRRGGGGGGVDSSTQQQLNIDRRQIQRDANAMQVTSFRIKLGASDVLVAHWRSAFITRILDAAEEDARFLFPAPAVSSSPYASRPNSRFNSAARGRLTQQSPMRAAPTPHRGAEVDRGGGGGNAAATPQQQQQPAIIPLLPTWERTSPTDKCVLVCSELPLVLCITRGTLLKLLKASYMEALMVEGEGIGPLASTTSTVGSAALTLGGASISSLVDGGAAAASPIRFQVGTITPTTPLNAAAASSSSASSSSAAAAAASAPPAPPLHHPIPLMMGFSQGKFDPLFKTAERMLCRSCNSYRWAPLSIVRVVEAVENGSSLTRLVDQYEVAVSALAQ